MGFIAPWFMANDVSVGWERASGVRSAVVFLPQKECARGRVECSFFNFSRNLSTWKAWAGIPYGRRKRKKNARLNFVLLMKERSGSRKTSLPRYCCLSQAKPTQCAFALSLVNCVSPNYWRSFRSSSPRCQKLFQIGWISLDLTTPNTCSISFSAYSQNLHNIFLFVSAAKKTSKTHQRICFNQPLARPQFKVIRKFLFEIPRKM